MTKDNYGVWEIKIPPKASGEPAIPHDSKVKVSDMIQFLSLLLLSSGLAVMMGL